MKIRALIVDDEPSFCEEIRALLMAESDIRVAGECATGSKAIAAILACHPDLVILDIEMPQMCGFDVLETIPPEYRPEVIFVTDHHKHALRAFDFHPLDYLLKPLDCERFQRALQRARKRLHHGPSGEVRTQLLAVLQALRKKEQYRQRITVCSNGRMSFVPVDHIDWIGAAGNYAHLHVGRNCLLLRETLQSLESTLDPENFVRIHRSTIVNAGRVQELQFLFRGSCNVVLRDGTRLAASAGFRDNLVASLAGGMPLSSPPTRFSPHPGTVSPDASFSSGHPKDRLPQFVKPGAVALGA